MPSWYTSMAPSSLRSSYRKSVVFDSSALLCASLSLQSMSSRRFVSLGWGLRLGCASFFFVSAFGSSTLVTTTLNLLPSAQSRIRKSLL